MNLVKLYTDSFTGLHKDVWSLALIYLVNRSGEMVIPFLSIYLTTQLGFSKTQSAIVLCCFGIGAIMGSNLGGRLSDKIGNFKVMALSLAGMGVTFISIVFFTGFYPLCFWMILVGLVASMFSPAAFSAVSMWGNPDNKTRGYSLLRLAINLGISIGPALGGFFAFKYGYHWLFVLDGVTCFIALATLFYVLGHRNFKYDKTKPKVKETSSPYSDGTLLLFLFFNLINMVAFFQILFAVPVYFKEELLMDEWLIGAFFTANGLLILFLEMPIVHHIERANKYFKPLAWGAILIGIAYLSLSIFDNPIIAIISYSLLVGIGEVINFPLIPSLAMRRSDEHNQGKYMGVVSMMFAMAFLLAPISGLPIIEYIGFEMYWYIAASFSIVSGLGLWVIRKRFAE